MINKVDDAYEVRVRDLRSAVNKEYLNEKFLKVDKDGNYFDLKQNTIKNCEPYYDELFDDRSLVSKEYVDTKVNTENAKQTIGINHNSQMISNSLLHLDGSKQMTGALDMNNNEIKNLKDPVNDQDAATKQNVANGMLVNIQTSLTYTNTKLAKKLDLSSGNMTGDINLLNSHKILSSLNPSSDTDLVTKKYMETHVNHSHITSSNKSNAFKYIMENPSILVDEDDIEFGNLVTFQSSPHSINKNVIATKLLFDPGDGYYSSRAAINLYILSSGSYTLAFELIWSGDYVDSDTVS